MKADEVGSMKACVYTALFGSYDGLLEQPVSTQSNLDFICFTDDPALTSETWEIQVVEPSLAQDSIRSARLIKILGHERLREFDATLYIDASVVLRQPPEEILAEWLVEGVDMALAAHSYRDQLVDEFDEIIKLNYDDRARVYEQLTDYAMGHPDALVAKPLWTGILARRRTPAVSTAMRIWADHVLRYSRRDQLSILVALCEGGVSYRVTSLDNFDAPSHQWPVIPDRRISRGKAAPLPAGPLVADLRRALLRVEGLARRNEELEAAVAVTRELEKQREVLDAEIDRLTSSLARTEALVQSQTGVRAALRALRTALATRLMP
ncbi:glycosyltransferase domain-containing protein [Microbacterium sp. SS28]|uniref:glycosyltransferase domain-containing protein n=1 Tax=Microbacterium sp. SS28 TaxID=2919948 RepID=UPI001FA9F249|nr:glycosyltransferase domain-containing protein [Microbacterium sp. SS28]